MDEARRAKILAAETAAAAQNAASKDVGAAKARGDDAEFERLRALVAEKKAEGARLTEEAGAEDARLRDALMRIANLPLDEVPEGPDETANVEIRRWGTPGDIAAAVLAIADGAFPFSTGLILDVDGGFHVRRL